MAYRLGCISPKFCAIPVGKPPVIALKMKLILSILRNICVRNTPIDQKSIKVMQTILNLQNSQKKQQGLKKPPKYTLF